MFNLDFVALLLQSEVFLLCWGNGCVIHLLHSQIGRLFLACRMLGSQKCSRHVCWHVGSEQLKDFRSDNLHVAS